VPRALEIRLSPEERAAYDQLVENLRNTPKGTTIGQAAYRAIFDKVWDRFAPLFKAELR